MTIDITDANGTPVAAFQQDMEYTISTPAYNGASTNAWLYVSDGAAAPVAESTTHQQAGACPQAAFSSLPQEKHTFEWTAPSTGDCVTVSVVQAAGSTDVYHTATVRPFPPLPSAAQ